ncbi:MAG: 50S ribosomal protein L9 [Acidaminococcaceae bacterium]|nr:50S ribosomal protein L9 [Acidaminococcaceae bacterium]
MKVILLQDVKTLGKKGDLTEVAEGYGRNFLLPRKLAKEATLENINQAKATAATAAHHAAVHKDEATVLAAQMQKLTVTVKVKVGANEKIFGTVTSKDIAESIKTQTGLDIDRRKIELKNQVKGLGLHTAYAKLHPDVTAEFQVNVIKGE